MIWFDSLAKPPSPQRIPPFAFRLAIPAALREVLFVLSILRSHPPGNAEPQLGSHSYSSAPNVRGYSRDPSSKLEPASLTRSSMA